MSNHLVCRTKVSAGRRSGQPVHRPRGPTGPEIAPPAGNRPSSRASPHRPDLGPPAGKSPHRPDRPGGRTAGGVRRSSAPLPRALAGAAGRRQSSRVASPAPDDVPMIRLFAPPTKDGPVRPDLVTATTFIVHLAAAVVLLVPFARAVKADLTDRLLVYLVPPDKVESGQAGPTPTPFVEAAPHPAAPPRGVDESGPP